jgi:hypothetical protein
LPEPLAEVEVQLGFLTSPWNVTSEHHIPGTVSF